MLQNPLKRAKISSITELKSIQKNQKNIAIFFNFRLLDYLSSALTVGYTIFDELCRYYFAVRFQKIFDENFSPHEFMIYCFLVSVGDIKGVSYWSVPKMAKKCNMCPTTCRNTLKALEEKGYIDITQRFFENAQQSNIYTVHQI